MKTRFSLGSVNGIEEFGRYRLSETFFVRDFLYSTIATHHGFRNLPDDPETFIEAGSKFCKTILEPLQKTFGRIVIRSAYRSPEVNDYGRVRYGTCAANEKNYAAHIWDYRTVDEGLLGASATIVIPAYLEHYEQTGEWKPLAWWLHDYVDYHEMCFFMQLCAFNIGWRDKPTRRIENWIDRKRLLTKPGMDNHSGLHHSNYAHVPMLSEQGLAVD